MKTTNRLSIVLLVIFMVGFLFTGCSTYYYALLQTPLVEVERPTDALDRYGEKKIEQVSNENNKIFQKYSDGLINIEWYVDTGGLSFEVTNKTKNSIKIIWDEAAYIDYNGKSCKVMHTGIKFTDRNLPQPPTVIPRGSTVSDIIIPNENVYYSDYSGWQKEYLFKRLYGDDVEELKISATSWIGKKIQVLLPLKHQEVVNEYIFTFEVQDFVTF